MQEARATDLRALYSDVLDHVLNDGMRLPSMPEVAMEVRKAAAHDDTTCESLAAIINKDPGLVLYLVQAASSPVYRRAVVPKTLNEVINILGFSATSSLVMLYSTKNLVTLEDAASKRLFQHTWDRLVIKTSIASFLAKQFKFYPVDRVQMAMLLTEIGSLSVLSAMLSEDGVPDTEIYFDMCRLYGKHLGVEVLKKWEMEDDIIDVQIGCGHWSETNGDADKLSMLDIANLSLYHTVRKTVDKPKLPPLNTIAAFSKIPEEFRGNQGNPNWLDIVVENDESIQEIISSFQ